MAKKNTTLQNKITFRLDDKGMKELEAYADRENISVSFVVRHLVNRFLEDQRRYPQYGEQVAPRISGF